MKIALPENIALLLHPRADVSWSLCCLCIISPSLAMEGQPEKRHNVRAQQQEDVSDWLTLFKFVLCNDTTGCRY